MKKVGFIDYFLDNWHAKTYPNLFESRAGGKYQVCYAYAFTQTPNKGGMTNEDWAKKYGVQLLSSVEEVIEKSDCLMVLAPNHPQTHEMLTEKALRSGKLTYIDKTFAPDKETALRIFANADSHGTKCFSSSALRFAAEYERIDKAGIAKIYSAGPDVYSTYSIHQIEPVIALMNSRARRVMALDGETHPSLLIEFADGRYAQFIHRTDEKRSFTLTTVNKENAAKIYTVNSDYFSLFFDALIRFFDTGIVPVPHEQTVDVIAVRAAGMKALQSPFVWVEV